MKPGCFCPLNQQALSDNMRVEKYGKDFEMYKSWYLGDKYHTPEEKAADPKRRRTTGNKTKGGNQWVSKLINRAQKILVPGSLTERFEGHSDRYIRDAEYRQNMSSQEPPVPRVLYYRDTPNVTDHTVWSKAEEVDSSSEEEGP